MTLHLLLFSAATAAQLPGVDLPFVADEYGQWRLGETLPAVLVDAGVESGWLLTEVDGQSFDDPLAVQRRVARGPARNIHLRFSTDEEQGEAVLQAYREPLVVATQRSFSEWPSGLAGGVETWMIDADNAIVAEDQANTWWALDADAGTVHQAASVGVKRGDAPDLLWTLSDAPWFVDFGDEFSIVTASTARTRYAGAAYIPSPSDRSRDSIALAEPQGVRILEVSWPEGTPALPTCDATVPETCMTSAMTILLTLGHHRGAESAAAAQFQLACDHGVDRACFGATALRNADRVDAVDACMDGDALACREVAVLEFNASEVIETRHIGLLTHACALEAESQFEELPDDVGESCVQLAEAYDRLKQPDQAMLALDEACVLGREDACQEAEERRQYAYAARIVSECESPTNPIASSCVQLGRLLEERELPLATLDAFDAWHKACRLGSTDGCRQLGTYVDRWSIDHPRVIAAETNFRQTCEAGAVQACLGTGYLLVRHQPKADAYGEALTLFHQTCDASIADGCVAGATQRRIGRARRVEAPAQLAFWEQACELSSPQGCAGLGEERVRSRRTHPEAFTAWSKACDLGDAHSCSQLGKLVAKPHSPRWEDEQPAPAYLKKGCDQGDPAGCFWLAELDLPKKGEPTEESYILLDTSCAGEYGDGCAKLADVHLDRKTSFDDEIAARHLETACANGTYESCRVLGVMYQRGKGVERDRQRARELLDRFRQNASAKHLRLGAQFGLWSLVGAELEGVLPIPVGPALSIGGTYSYIPSVGRYLVPLTGEDTPDESIPLTTYSVSARIYPNTQARGLFAAVGYHELSTPATASGVAAQSRAGWNARLGVRTQRGPTYSSLEFGIGSFGNLSFDDFDEGSSGSLPLILPTFAVSFGAAFL